MFYWLTPEGDTDLDAFDTLMPRVLESYWEEMHSPAVTPDFLIYLAM